MRIATYNVNGINGRLANLLMWLEETAPDIVCLQELKAPDDKFPAAAVRAISVGPYSGTAVPLMGSARMPRCTQRSRACSGVSCAVDLSISDGAQAKPSRVR